MTKLNLEIRVEKFFRYGAAVLVSVFLIDAAARGSEPLQVSHPNPVTLRLSEGRTAVWDYVFTPMDHSGIDPADPRFRAGCYFHPLYGFDGEILTADATPWDNHAHHHGLWASFTTVNLRRATGTEHYDTWTDNTPLKRDFIRFLEQKMTEDGFFFRVENGWFLFENSADLSACADATSDNVDRREQVAEEILEVMTSPTRIDAVAGRWRTLDFTWRFRPLHDPMELAGDRAFGKDFSSMAIRFLPPAQKPRILSDEGELSEDVMSIPRRWVAYQSDFTADLEKLVADHPDYLHERGTPVSSIENGKTSESPVKIGGAAIFPSPENPPFDGGWAIRHYGLIATGWPGTAGAVLDPNDSPVTLRYRLLLYENSLDVDDIARFYEDYLYQFSGQKVN